MKKETLKEELKEKLISKLTVENCKNLSDAEIQRCLGGCVSADRLISLAYQMRENNELPFPIDIEKRRRQVRDALNKTKSASKIESCAEILEV